MAWLVAAGDLAGLIEFVLLSIATKLEVLQIENYFDVYVRWSLLNNTLELKNLMMKLKMQYLQVVMR